MKKKWLLILSASLIISSEISFGADTGSCGPNCVYNYDPNSQTITFSIADSNNTTPAVIDKYVPDYDLSGPAENVIINEGITKVVHGQYATIRFDDGKGGGTGKLVLPESLTNISDGGFWKSKFSIIEFNSKNLNVANSSFCFENTATPTMVISADANIIFEDNAFYYSSNPRGWYLPTSLNIQCKGNPDVCLSKFGNSLNNMKGSITADYYEERDSNGNLILKYNDNGYEKYDDQGNILAKYDLKGNLLQSRVYNADGSVLTYDKNGKIVGIQGKKILTVEEATAIANGNRNTFTIRYR